MEPEWEDWQNVEFLVEDLRTEYYKVLVELHEALVGFRRRRPDILEGIEIGTSLAEETASIKNQKIKG